MNIKNSIKRKLFFGLCLLATLILGRVIYRLYEQSQYITQPTLTDEEIKECETNIVSYGSISDYLELVNWGHLTFSDLRRLSNIMAFKYDYPDAFYYIALSFETIEDRNTDSLLFYLEKGAFMGSTKCCKELLKNDTLSKKSKKSYIDIRRRILMKDFGDVKSRHTMGYITRVQITDSVEHIEYKYTCKGDKKGEDWLINTNIKEGDSIPIIFSAEDCTISLILGPDFNSDK